MILIQNRRLLVKMSWLKLKRLQWKIIKQMKMWKKLHKKLLKERIMGNLRSFQVLMEKPFKNLMKLIHYQIQRRKIHLLIKLQKVNKPMRKNKQKMKLLFQKLKNQQIQLKKKKIQNLKTNQKSSKIQSQNKKKKLKNLLDISA